MDKLTFIIIDEQSHGMMNLLSEERKSLAIIMSDELLEDIEGDYVMWCSGVSEDDVEKFNLDELYDMLKQVCDESEVENIDIIFYYINDSYEEWNNRDWIKKIKKNNFKNIETYFVFSKL